MTEERNNVLLVPNAAPRFKPNTGGDRDSTLVGSLTPRGPRSLRSEEHTSELQSLMRISYAVFCLKKKKNTMNKKLNIHYYYKIVLYKLYICTHYVYYSF